MSMTDDRYHSLFDSLPIGLYRTTPDGRFLDVNLGLVEILGYSSREALLATPVREIWADPDERLRFLDRLGREGVVRNCEVRVRRFDGKILWVRNEARAVSDGSANVLAYEGAIQNVNPQREAEAALRESESQFRRSLDASPVPIAIHREGTFVYVNRAALDLVGASNESQVVGQPIFAHVHPDYREAVRERVRQGYEARRPAELLIEKLLRVDGEEVVVETAALPVIFEGKAAMEVLVRDVTERRRAEERLRASEARLAEAQEIAHLGSWELDPKTYRVAPSRELLEVVGIEAPGPEVSFDFVRQHLYEDELGKIYASIEKALQEGGPLSVDCRIRRNDGTERFLHVQGRLVRDEEGRPTRLVGVAQDITERKRFEQELAEARDAALEASRLKSAFLANMSHEIRTPLNVILGYNTLVVEHLWGLGDHSQDDVLRRVERAGRRLMQTIHGVLDLSKIETGGFEIHPRAIELATLVQRQVQEVEVLAKQKGLALSLTLEAAGALVRFDEYCLSQALANLLSNAIKFTDQGSVRVRLSRDGEERLCIEVADTGIGIDTQYRSRLFDAFSQEHSGYARQFEGSGLGLALTRKYLELNDSTIHVESEKGKGSCFRIEIPRERELATGEPRLGGALETSETLSLGVPSGDGQRPLVLVVEDDPDTQGYVRAILESRYRVLTAASGAEARRHLADHGDEVRLVVMDLSLKGDEDGLGLTAALRQESRWKRLPILATTAHAFLADRDRSLAAGCNDYLAKPFSPRDLLRALDSLLEG